MPIQSDKSRNTQVRLPLTCPNSFPHDKHKQELLDEEDYSLIALSQDSFANINIILRHIKVLKIKYKTQTAIGPQRGILFRTSKPKYEGKYEGIY